MKVMTIRRAALAVLLMVGVSQASALNLAGAEIPAMIRASDQSRPWPLAGTAMVHRSFIPFYGLALHTPSEMVGQRNMGEGLTSLQLTLVWYATSLPKVQVQAHFRKLFEQVADAETLVNSATRLEKLLSILPDAERGRRITFLYSPDGGMAITVEGSPAVQFAGIEFNRALLAMWLSTKADPEVFEGLMTRPQG